MIARVSSIVRSSSRLLASTVNEALLGCGRMLTGPDCVGAWLRRFDRCERRLAPSWEESGRQMNMKLVAHLSQLTVQSISDMCSRLPMCKASRISVAEWSTTCLRIRPDGLIRLPSGPWLEPQAVLCEK